MNDYYFTCTDEGQVILIDTLTKLGIVETKGEGKEAIIYAKDGDFSTVKNEAGMNISILRTPHDVLLKTEEKKSTEAVVDTFSKNTAKFFVVEEGVAKFPIDPIIVML